MEIYETITTLTMHLMVIPLLVQNINVEVTVFIIAKHKFLWLKRLLIEVTALELSETFCILFTFLLSIGYDKITSTYQYSQLSLFINQINEH